MTPWRPNRAGPHAPSLYAEVDHAWSQLMAGLNAERLVFRVAAACDAAKQAALEGMQMTGGYGYATEYGMELHLRSAVVSTVYGGTSEIQRDIIGKSFGL